MIIIIGVSGLTRGVIFSNLSDKYSGEFIIVESRRKVSFQGEPTRRIRAMKNRREKVTCCLFGGLSNKFPPESTIGASSTYRFSLVCFFVHGSKNPETYSIPNGISSIYHHISCTIRNKFAKKECLDNSTTVSSVKFWDQIFSFFFKFTFFYVRFTRALSNLEKSYVWNNEQMNVTICGIIMTQNISQIF